MKLTYVDKIRNDEIDVLCGSIHDAINDYIERSLLDFNFPKEIISCTLMNIVDNEIDRLNICGIEKEVYYNKIIDRVTFETLEDTENIKYFEILIIDTIFISKYSIIIKFTNNSIDIVDGGDSY